MSKKTICMSEFNLKSTTIEKSLDIAEGFLKSLVGQPIEELGLLLKDSVKHWRLKNQLRVLEKVKATCEKAGMPLRQVNLKVLFPYLEAVSLEEDEKLQNLWANLLANYIDESKKLEATVYPEILRQLSSKDVEILENYYSVDIVYDTNKLPLRKTNKQLEYSVTELANIERLGLIRPILKTVIPSGQGGGILSHWEYEYQTIRVSHFGDEFYKACHR